MPQDFMQYLVVFLVMLLFARDYLGALVKKWLGIEVKNGNGTEHRIKDLEEHAKVANEEMQNVVERLVAIETKLDIVIKHLKI